MEDHARAAFIPLITRHHADRKARYIRTHRLLQGMLQTERSRDALHLFLGHFHDTSGCQLSQRRLGSEHDTGAGGLLGLHCHAYDPHELRQCWIVLPACCTHTALRIGYERAW